MPHEIQLNEVLKLGDIDFNSTQDQVLSLLGSRPVKTLGRGSQADSEYWTFSNLGLSLTWTKKKSESVWSLGHFSAYGPCRLTTPQGVGIGTPLDYAQHLYQPLMNRLSKPTYLVVGTFHQGAFFEARNGAITNIWITRDGPESSH